MLPRGERIRAGDFISEDGQEMVMHPGSDPHGPAGNQQTKIEDALSSSSASGTPFLSFGEST